MKKATVGLIWGLILGSILIQGCEKKKALDYEPGNYIKFEYVKDTFINVDVHKQMVKFSFEPDTLHDYDLIFMTVPLVVKTKEGSYIFAREPFIRVNPDYLIAKVTTPNLEETTYPKAFTRDSVFHYMEVIWDSLEGKTVYFRLPSGRIIERKFLKVSPDTLIVELDGSPYYILGYEDKYLNMETLMYDEPSSAYDTTYHIHFKGFVPELNIFAGWGVAVSIGSNVDSIKTMASGQVVDENKDGDDFYTDKYVSILGSDWYMLDDRHRIVPRQEVYIVRKNDREAFAFKILSYYHPEDTLRSGYFTIRYGKLK